MTELLSSAQMRAIEQAAIDSGRVTGLELMERAGRGVVEAVFEQWPQLAETSHRAVVLCGPGNNGGDGFVVARLLHEWGWDIEVFLFGDAAKLPPDARANYERWLELGAVAPLDACPKDCFSADIYIDALFGTGLVRPVDGVPGQILSALSGRSKDLCRLVCVDIQSGICADSGHVLGGFDRPTADLTVTFHRAKLGHYLSDGAALSGRIVEVDIGLPRDWRVTKGLDWRQFVHKTDRPDGVFRHQLLKHHIDIDAHKFTHGHALVLSGGPGHTGAARLAARGALRIGAGLVTLGVPPAAQQEAAAQLTAIMLKRVGDTPALERILDDPRINALCLGPALGLTEDKAKLIETALKTGCNTVLDADALTLVAQNRDLAALLHENCVLTPHAGEFARLFPEIADKLNAAASQGPAYSKVDATRAAAEAAGCTVLFKGADTVIASADGCCSLNSSHPPRSAPWLATAGSGDVLAGFITGLLARGYTPQIAAETGAWLHTECARTFGAGLIAEDLPDMLPEVFRNLAS